VLSGDLRTQPLGIAYLKTILEATKFEIQEKGRLSNESLERLVCTIGLCAPSAIVTSPHTGMRFDAAQRKMMRKKAGC
jgi:hypothetical protein